MAGKDAFDTNLKAVLDSFEGLEFTDEERSALLKQFTEKCKVDEVLVEQVVEVLPGLEGEEVDTKPSVAALRFAQHSKPGKYKAGENFSRFCDRFLVYVKMSEVVNRNLYLLLLQNLDDETFAMLQNVQLSDEEKRDAQLFCNVYKKAMYGEEEQSLKSDLFDYTQSPNDSITEFAFKLKEKGELAFSDKEQRSDACLTAFLRGINDSHIKRKLNETRVENFEDAIKTAKRLERVDRMMNPNPTSRNPIKAILKESSRVDFESGSQEPERQSRPRARSNSWSRRSDDRDNSQGRYTPARHREYSPSSSPRYASFNGERQQGGYRRDQRSATSRSRREPPTCWTCNRTGHVQRNCWSRRDSFGNGNGNGRRTSSNNQGSRDSYRPFNSSSSNMSSPLN